MIALYIISVLIFLLFLASLIPVYIIIRYNDDMDISIRYLFLKHKFNAKAKKDYDSKKEKISKSYFDKRFSIKDIVHKKGISGLLDIIKEFTRFTIEIGKEIVSDIVFDYIDIDISVGGEDSKSIAMKYGYVCSCIYPFVSLICTVSHLKKKKVNITANFQSEEDIIKFYSKFHIRPVKLLFSIPRALFKCSKVIKA